MNKKFEEIVGIDSIYSKLSYFRKYIGIEEKPEWAKFWVVDAKGRAMWCESMPIPDRYYKSWRCGGRNRIDKHLDPTELFSEYSWEDSFVELKHLLLEDVDVQKLDIKNIMFKLEEAERLIEYKFKDIEKLKFKKSEYENKIKELNELFNKETKGKNI